MCSELCVLAVLLVNVATEHIPLSQLLPCNSDASKHYSQLRGRNIGTFRGHPVNTGESAVQSGSLYDNLYKWRNSQFLPDFNRRWNKNEILSKRKNLTLPDNNQSVIDKIIRDYLSKFRKNPEVSSRSDGFGNIKFSGLHSKVSNYEPMKAEWRWTGDRLKNISNDLISTFNKPAKLTSDLHDAPSQIYRSRDKLIGSFDSAPAKTVYSAKDRPPDETNPLTVTKVPLIQTERTFTSEKTESVKNLTFDLKKVNDEFLYPKPKTFQNLTSNPPPVEVQTESFFKSSMKWSPIIEKSLENFDNITKDTDKIISEAEIFKKAADLFNAINLENPFSLNNLPLFLNYLNKENLACSNTTPKAIPDSQMTNILKTNYSDFDERFDSLDNLKKGIAFFLAPPSARNSMVNLPTNDSRSKYLCWSRRRGNDFLSRNASRGPYPLDYVNPISLMFSQNTMNVPLLLIPLNKAYLEQLLAKCAMFPNETMISIPNPYIDPNRKVLKPDPVFKPLSETFKDDRFKNKLNITSPERIFNNPLNNTVFKASGSGTYLEDSNYKKRVESILKYTKPSLNSNIKPSSSKGKQYGTLGENVSMTVTFRANGSSEVTPVPVCAHQISTMSSIFKKHQQFLTNMLPLLNTTSDMAISKFSNEKKIINFEKGSGNNANIKGNLLKIQQEMTTEQPVGATISNFAQTVQQDIRKNYQYTIIPNNSNILHFGMKVNEPESESTTSSEYLQVYFSDGNTKSTSFLMMTGSEMKTDEIPVQVSVSPLAYEHNKYNHYHIGGMDTIPGDSKPAIQFLDKTKQELFSEVGSTTEQNPFHEVITFREFLTDISNYSFPESLSYTIIMNMTESGLLAEAVTEYPFSFSSSSHENQISLTNVSNSKYPYEILEDIPENPSHVKAATFPRLPLHEGVTPPILYPKERIILVNYTLTPSNSMISAIRERDDLLTRRGPNIFLTNLVNRLLQIDNNNANSKTNVFDDKNSLNKNTYTIMEPSLSVRNKILAHRAKSKVNSNTFSFKSANSIQEADDVKPSETNSVLTKSDPKICYSNNTSNDNLNNIPDKTMYPTVVFNLLKSGDMGNNPNVSNEAFHMVYVGVERKFPTKEIFSDIPFNLSSGTNPFDITNKRPISPISAINEASLNITNDTSDSSINSTDSATESVTDISRYSSEMESSNSSSMISNTEGKIVATSEMQMFAASTERSHSEMNRYQSQILPSHNQIGMKGPVIYVTLNTVGHVPSSNNVTQQDVPLKIFIIRAPFNMNTSSMMRSPEYERISEMSSGDVLKSCVTPNPQKKCLSEVTLFPIYPMYPVYPIKPLLSSSTSQSNIPPCKSKCLI